ncbi:MAG: VOC family protein [Gammaproteobacteria bacterium]|nr:VOC family protein [Gammaproteobacteria bacterium]
MSDGIRGTFVWHELMASDPGSAAAFYRDVIGWDTRPWGHHVAYTLCVAPAGPVAGIMALPEEARAAGAPPCWMAYVGTPDLDATIAHASGLGGRVLKGATEIEGAGRYAVLADPQGASFGIYTPRQSAPQPAAASGQFVWHELAADDVDAALGFYGALFGWEAMRRMDMGESGPYVIFGSQGVQRGGMYRQPPEQGGAHWLAYAQVASVESATAVAVAAGARVLHGPADVPGGRITMLIDPQGVAFAVHSAAISAARPAAARRGGQTKAKSRPETRDKAKAKPKAKPKAKAGPAKLKGKATAKSKQKPATRRTGGAARRAGAKPRAAAKRRSGTRRPAAVRRKGAARSPTRRRAARRHR